jgi:hypothetical protein
VAIVYTPASNIFKKPEHEIGQVSFRDEAKVRRIRHVARDREVLRALEKTFREEYPDLQQLLLNREKEEERAKAKAVKEAAILQKELDKERKRIK